jgi:signal transduction histidine kinase
MRVAWTMAGALLGAARPCVRRMAQRRSATRRRRLGLAAAALSARHRPAGAASCGPDAVHRRWPLPVPGRWRASLTAPPGRRSSKASNEFGAGAALAARAGGRPRRGGGRWRPASTTPPTRIEAAGEQRTSSLLANASHELRSPLARLKHGAVDAWRTPGSPPSASAWTARCAAQHQAELDALVDEVLLASRLDAAVPSRSIALPLELVSLCRRAEAAQRGRRTAGDMTRELAGGRPTSGLLRRALRNLLENALRYGVEPSRQRVSV